jgi:peroxiredoxin
MNRTLFALTLLTIVVACAPIREIARPPLPTESAYRIDVSIKGEKNRAIRLCKYYGTDIVTVNTAVLDNKGTAIFSGDSPLIPGMYAVVSREVTAFDFLISDTVNQHFGISTTKNKYLETLSFNGSAENELFADYSRRIYERKKKEIRPFHSAAELESLTLQIDAKESEIATKFHGSLLQSVASAMNPVRPNGNISVQGLSEFRVRHYWDKLQLSDRRILNTPILASAIDEYFDTMIAPIHDSIICAIDFVMSKAASDTATTNFMAKYLFDKYINYSNDNNESQLTGAENVAVHIVDNYYRTERAIAHDPQFSDQIFSYADRIRPTLIGKQAKELRMETITGGAESLYDINSPYVAVCFFDVACHLCRQEIPEIYKVFQRFKERGLTVFCVYVRDNRAEWLEFVSQHKLTGWLNVWDPKNTNDFRIAYSLYSVPQIYLLDANKTIIGRGLNAVSLTRLLNDLITHPTPVN